jgi:hypothetical protein
MPITLAHVARALLPTLPTGRALAPREWRTLTKVAEVFLEGVDLNVTAEQTADNVERFLLAGRSRRAWRVRVLLTVIDLSTLPTHARPFMRLPLDARRDIVRHKWMGGRHVWRICGKVRNLVLLGAYGDREASARTGYVPVPLRPRFIKRAAAPMPTAGAS